MIEDNGEAVWRSKYAPFLTIFDELYQMKQALISKLNNIATNANDIYQLAYTLYDHSYFFTQEEKKSLLVILGNLEYAVSEYYDARDKENIKGAISDINTYIHTFIAAWMEGMQAHGGALILERQGSEIDQLAMVMGAQTFFVNSYGLPISWSQEIISRFAISRMQQKFDNLIFVYGRRGYGKTTWTAETVTQMYEDMNKPFELAKHIIIGQSKKDLFENIKRWKPGEVYWLDEFINQANSRTSIAWDQTQLMELFVEIRKKQATAFMLMPDLSMLDKALREHMITLLVHVTERGRAMILAPSLAPTELDRKSKEAIMIPENLTDYVERTAKNKIIESRFFEIPEYNDLWEEYLKLSNEGIENKQFVSKELRTEQKARIYDKFLASVNDDMLNKGHIYFNEFKEFEMKNNVAVPPNDLAKYVMNKFNLNRSSVIDTKSQVLWLENPLVKRYVKKMRDENGEDNARGS